MPLQKNAVFNSVCLSVCASVLCPGYTSAGTPYKVPPTQSNGAPPPYTPTPTPYPTAMYPIRSAYPQQNIYAQVRAQLLPLLVTSHLVSGIRATKVHRTNRHSENK